MAQADIKALYEAGAHFGHKTSRWHPKMAGYIHSKRGDSHVINLEKTVAAFDEVLPLVTKTVASGKKVLFVGTKKQAKAAVQAAAESCDQPYVVNRWIGGMLTNVDTITRQIRKLRDLEKRMAAGDLEKRYNKLEVQRFQEEIELLNLKYGGIKDLSGKPGMVIVLDTLVDVNAVREAKNLGIPVVGVVDTNANPDSIDYVIPANDDALKAIQAYLDLFVAAVQEGLGASKKADEKKEK
ncbi:MAG TPA: 30S ribosomal protein S2 [Patescibacteria group bacterium]|jgi:small subunit ribosomal protein S2|nr:30S ribosomal protein S2 [Patescibacteria group bacterium]